ncbi:MAG: response regulator [Saprospiraceae bacterium]
MRIAVLIVPSVVWPGFAIAQATSTQQQNLNGGLVFYVWFLIAALLALLIGMYVQYAKGKSTALALEAEKEKIRRLTEILNQQKNAIEKKENGHKKLHEELVEAQAEKKNLEESSLSSNKFLASMSRKMREPLNAILSVSHELIEKHKNDGIVETLRQVQYAANDLLVYINDVLYFSKIEAGKLCLDEREFEPTTLFEDVMASCEKAISEKDLVLNFQLSPKVPEKLIGNGVQLRQVVSGLMEVATQHARQGAIRVAITPEELFQWDIVLKITINYSDAGTGLELFESLSQSVQVAPESSSLPVLKRLIELQNGRLEVELRSEDFTLITLYLPYKIPRSTDASPAQEIENPLSGKKVLVVEDNKINQLVVANALRSKGMEVVATDNGKEAVEAFDSQYFDLVLMDIQMPVMDGYQATAIMRRHKDEKKKNVPIIALTASAVLTEKERANLFGMTDRLGKPFALEELIDKINVTLELHASVFNSQP